MIVVKTPYGEKALDATDFDEGDGHLYVYKDGRRVGLFARGEWERALVETPVSEPAKTPRVWQSIRDVPQGVVVSDQDGDHFHWEGEDLYFGKTCWGLIGSSFDEDLRPFTEVLVAE
ncbi:hypothetical protein FGG39_gp51 [Mycobacterium phage Saintus]|uniref:Uncharacterized protein n=1 Tax=Mycobacterium phage Saintus TaxID=2923007 RepID=G8IRD4_9CAUD|nr:hypothetical protein FGG39_gp51 [Mycobacterium phage Saintus]AER26435.1 hypothetical protein SAINTUS_51 [Mycobacterium phage Saintus]